MQTAQRTLSGLRTPLSKRVRSRRPWPYVFVSIGHADSYVIFRDVEYLIRVCERLVREAQRPDFPAKRGKTVQNIIVIGHEQVRAFSSTVSILVPYELGK